MSQEEKGTQMDTVLVAPETFREVTFKSATPKEEFLSQADRDAGKQRGQARTKDGQLKWQVKLAVETYRGDDEFITVGVAMNDDPGSLIARNQLVTLPGLRYGVMPKYKNGNSGERQCIGFNTWFVADNILPVNAK